MRLRCRTSSNSLNITYCSKMFQSVVSDSNASFGSLKRRT